MLYTQKKIYIKKNQQKFYKTLRLLEGSGELSDHFVILQRAVTLSL